MTMHIAVPTVTIIAYRSNNPFEMLLVKPANNKHGGRPVLVGGKIDLAKGESKKSSILREWHEEAGGRKAVIINPVEWTTRTDLYAEPRETRLGKVVSGHCPFINTTIEPVKAFYACPDFIFKGAVEGEPWPKDDEIEKCLWFDLRDLKIAPTPEESEFGGQHDLILGAYFLEIQGHRLMDKYTMFADCKRLREWLRSQRIGAMMA
jgi:8-oxo-dGTP pyrophosphatase MutT (NUDIX family)